MGSAAAKSKNASSRKGYQSMSGPALAVYVSRLTGGETLPVSGKFTFCVWAAMFGRDEDTVRIMFDGADILYQRFGGLRLFDAVDVNPAVPKVTKSTDPEWLGNSGKRPKQKV